MAIFIELTSAGGVGSPAVNEKVVINPIQIIKFWANGTGTKIFMTGLSTQEEELDVNETYEHVKQQLGGARLNT